MEKEFLFCFDPVRGLVIAIVGGQRKREIKPDSGEGRGLQWSVAVYGVQVKTQ